MSSKTTNNDLPKCVVCKTGKVKKISKHEVKCTKCGSQYPVEVLTAEKKSE